MNILTYFDQSKILDRWRVHVEGKFSALPNSHFTHTYSLVDAISRVDSGYPNIVIASFSDGKDGLWMKLFSHVKDNQIPVMITGDLDKEYYRRAFCERASHTLEILDAVQYYGQVEGVLGRIRERYAHNVSERSE